MGTPVVRACMNSASSWDVAVWLAVIRMFEGGTVACGLVAGVGSGRAGVRVVLLVERWRERRF